MPQDFRCFEKADGAQHADPARYGLPADASPGLMQATITCRVLRAWPSLGSVRLLCAVPDKQLPNTTEQRRRGVGFRGCSASWSFNARERSITLVMNAALLLIRSIE